MTTITEQRRSTGHRAEAAVTRELQAAGFTVTNLNDLVGNCPFADLLARKATTRLLIQVKGTVTIEGSSEPRPPGCARSKPSVPNWAVTRSMHSPT